jgi:hypothetical protein
MVLTKAERKVLRKMESTPLPKSYIPNFRELYEADFIHDVYTDETDPFGAPIPSGKYHVTTKYWRYKESYKSEWLWKFVPIAISFTALVISFVALFH